MILISDNYNSVRRLLTVLILLVALPGLVVAQSKKEKRIAKTYDVSRSTEVLFENTFGLLQIETWDRNQVEVEIVVSVEMRNEKDAQKALDKIDIKIEDGSLSSRLAFTTQVASMNNSNGERFSIDYRIKMPGNLKLTANNKFGETVIGDYSGDLTLRNEYGHLRADRLTGDSEVEVKFGKGEVDYMKGGELNVSYSDFRADRLDNTESSFSFSDVRIDQVGSINLKIKYGELVIDQIKSLKGSADFTSIRIDELSDELVLTGSYISDLSVDRVMSGFSLIDVKNSFGETTLGFSNGTGADIEADFSFGELKYDKALGIKFSRLEEEGHNSKSYRGSFGNAKGKIRLRGNYASGRLKIE
jgi:hypothetical protein